MDSGSISYYLKCTNEEEVRKGERPKFVIRIVLEEKENPDVLCKESTSTFRSKSKRKNCASRPSSARAQPKAADVECPEECNDSENESKYNTLAHTGEASLHGVFPIVQKYSAKKIFDEDTVVISEGFLLGKKYKYRVLQGTQTILRPLECRYCSERFSTHLELGDHFKRNHQLSCSICRLSFHDKLDLESHRNVEHSKRWFKCDGCNRILSSQRRYNQHCRSKGHLQNVYVQELAVKNALREGFNVTYSKSELPKDFKPKVHRLTKYWLKNMPPGNEDFLNSSHLKNVKQDIHPFLPSKSEDNLCQPVQQSDVSSSMADNKCSKSHLEIKPKLHESSEAVASVSRGVKSCKCVKPSVVSVGVQVDLLPSWYGTNNLPPSQSEVPKSPKIDNISISSDFLDNAPLHLLVVNQSKSAWLPHTPKSLSLNTPSLTFNNSLYEDMVDFSSDLGFLQSERCLDIYKQEFDNIWENCEDLRAIF